MVRIGGGWDTLESYLDRHDPCRCNSKRRHLSVIIFEDKRDIRLYTWYIPDVVNHAKFHQNRFRVLAP